MSKLRGNLGGMRYSVSRGRQIVAARSTGATQTNTYARVLQKVKLAPMVKFYQAAINNFFEFAFSNKEDKQTDYNAFCSVNMNLSPYLTKDANDRWPAYPAPYIVADGPIPLSFVYNDFYEGVLLDGYRGALVTDNCLEWDDQSHEWIAGAFTPIEEPYSVNDRWTVGEISAQLKALYNLYDGDKVTFLSVFPYNVAQELEGIIRFVPACAWNYASIIIDESDTTPIPTVDEVPIGKSELCVGRLPFADGSRVAVGVCSSAVGQESEVLGKRFEGGGMCTVIVTRYVDSVIVANRALLRFNPGQYFLGYSSGDLYMQARTPEAQREAVISYGYTEAPLDPASRSLQS